MKRSDRTGKRDTAQSLLEWLLSGELVRVTRKQPWWGGGRVGWGMEQRRLIGVRILVSRNLRPCQTHLIANWCIKPQSEPQAHPHWLESVNQLNASIHTQSHTHKLTLTPHLRRLIEPIEVLNKVSMLQTKGVWLEDKTVTLKYSIPLWSGQNK